MSNLRDLELVTSVDLSYASSRMGMPAYHFIYASQLYGTMFAIYGKFEGREVNINQEKAFQIDQASFKLVNYKGCINMGFAGGFSLLKESGNNGVDYRIDFSVRGASSIVDDVFHFGEDESLIVKRGECVQTLFVRTLLPLPDFERYLDKRENANGKQDPWELDDEPPITQFFDSEFNYKDGAYLYNQPIKPGLFDPRIPAAGRRCNESRVNFIF